MVWELNEIKPGDGGTMLASGSHKAAFKRPESLSNRESEIWDTYTCPAGSALIFTEALCHTGTRWTNENRQRLSLFHLYNAVNSRWGRSQRTQRSDCYNAAKTANAVSRCVGKRGE